MNTKIIFFWNIIQKLFKITILLESIPLKKSIAMRFIEILLIKIKSKLMIKHLTFL